MLKVSFHKRYIVLIFIGLFQLLELSSQHRVIWDVTELFGITTYNAKPGTGLALDSANKYFTSHPLDTVVLYYPEGSYDFLGEDPSIDFGEGWAAGTNGRLEITGEGYEKTVFISKDPRADAIYGRDVFRILFKGIHFTRDYVTVTQGAVVSVAPGEVIMDLHPGFPTPDSLIQFGRRNDAGLYLKKYTDDPEDPHIIPEEDNNQQLPWDTANTYLVSGRRWNFGLKNTGTLAPYGPGDVIGVKLKHGGQTYWLSGGDNIVFEECKWTRKTRGVLRGGISNIRFSGCMIDRGPKVGGRTPCLASPGGGPQCGQPNDPRVTNVIIENCRIESTGDDNYALFNVDGGIVRNCYFKDGFAEAPRLTQCTKICLQNNTNIRCFPLWVVGSGGDTESDCSLPDPYPPSKPENLRAVNVSHNSISLDWSPSYDNIGVSYYNIFQGSKNIGSSIDTGYTAGGLYPSVFYIFRVEAVDSSGNISVKSDMLEVTTSDSPVTFNTPDISTDPFGNWLVYPNPTRNFICIEMKHEFNDARLSIRDISGRGILEIQLEEKRTVVDISSLMPGLCYLELGNYETSTIKKLIVY